MTQLFLFRHAEPEADYAQRFLGQTNPQLSAGGRKQAGSIASLYPEAARFPVWTSPLLRALQTAEIAFPGVELRIEPLAMERHFGVLESLLPDEAARLYPEALKQLCLDPMAFVPNGGEGWSDLRSRARKLAPLLTTGAKVLISHQYIVIALACELTGLSLTNLLSLPLKYGECWIVVYDDANGRWSLRDTP
jgi:probable phosphoglycerate mutase